MSKIFDFFEKKEKKKNLFGTELEDLVPSDCLIPTVISKERVNIYFRPGNHEPVGPWTRTYHRVRDQPVIIIKRGNLQ